MDREEAIKILKLGKDSRKSESLAETCIRVAEGESYLSDEEEVQIREAIDMAIKALEQTSWIPVSERLPEDGELVLFSTKTDRVFEGRYFADNTDCQWYAFRDEAFAWNNVVTAWMPLPKPYEPQESEEKI